MARSVSISHANRLLKEAPRGCEAAARVNKWGRLSATLELDVEAAGLRIGRDQQVRLVLFAPDAKGGLRPVPTPDGRRALTYHVTVRPEQGSPTATVALEASLKGHEGEIVTIVAERAGRRLAGVAIAAGAVVATGAVAACLLANWGDPSARRGHYEGKSTDEIQADLDREVAWYEMEISVASHVTVPEGQTRAELRIENVPSNHCDQKVRVWETGNEDDVLFESGAIAPGEYLQHVELAHPLSAGTHSLTVQFQGYEREPTLVSNEGALLGHDTFGASCAAEVTLEVVPVR